MNNQFRKIIVVFLIIVLEGSYKPSYSSNAIVVKVGKNIVTSYEIENKIKRMIFFSNQELNQENVNNTKMIALKLLIETKLMLQELDKYNFDINKVNYNDYIKRIALQIQAKDINDFKYKLKVNGIDYDLYLDEVKINLSWQQLIYQLYSSKINIDENQITNELNEILKEKKYVEEFDLSEIEVLFNDHSKKEQIISQVTNSIEDIGFEKTATKLSLSDTSFNEGKIGWVNSESLSEEIKSILMDLNSGDYSEPIIKTNSVLFLKVNNKRKINKVEEINLDQLKKSIIDKKTDQIFKMYSKNYLSKVKSLTMVKYLN